MLGVKRIGRLLPTGTSLTVVGEVWLTLVNKIIWHLVFLYTMRLNIIRFDF